MKHAKKSSFSDILQNQPRFRAELIQKLFNYLTDPGRFAILLLGERGTGKSHWINEISKGCGHLDCLKEVITISGVLAKNTDAFFWERTFESANEKILVIEEVEELSKATQALLFEFLSTTNGLYGLKEKRFKCRIVFTSSLHIRTLRDSQDYLLNKFFDRISQFVVTFPGYGDKNLSIWDDFVLTWAKMNFPKKELPKRILEDWLRANSHRFHGNFRDLDKIAINWRNSQINFKKTETELLKDVENDFFELYHFPEHNSENPNAFYVDENMDYYKEIKPLFEKFVKEIARKKYGKLSKAKNGKPLGVHYRTMERW